MIASPNPGSDRTSNPPDANSVRWDGHMCDDVAATFGGEPCAFLSANADEIWLKGNRGDFRIPRRSVTKIGRDGMYPWFFRGVRIRHNVAGFPTNLQFKPMVGGVRDILTQLKTLGFPTG
jgi:hypothetical protein